MIDVTEGYEKVAVFDLDGTFTTTNSPYELLNDEIGVRPSFDRDMYMKFSLGDSYDEADAEFVGEIREIREYVEEKI